MTWLVPGEDRTFTPQSLPDDAFRPLSAWVDYVIEHEREAIQAWLGASQFQFEGFVCKEEQASEPPVKPAPGPKQPKTPKPDAAEPAPAEQKKVGVKKARPSDTADEETVPASPHELEVQLRSLEDRFVALQTPLEDPERQRLWTTMASLNGMLKHHGDAAVCWGNALWEQAGPTAHSLNVWFSHESGKVVHQPPTSAIVRILKEPALAQGQLRQVAAYLIWAAAEASPPADLAPHLSSIQRFLEKHEAHLGIRVLWLAWHALYRLTGNDVLNLARARDRILERLFQQGLTPDLDLPGFLRFSALQASQRFRAVRDQILRLRTTVHDWARTGTNPTPSTRAYIDLIFAYGLARLGEAAEARNLLGGAAETLAFADEIHSWLYAAFEVRVQQALDGKAAADRLPDRMHDELAAIERPDYLQHITDKKQLDDVIAQQRLLRLKIDRLRENSRILEPTEKVDPWRRFHGRFTDSLAREIGSLSDIQDRAVLLERLDKLLKGKQKFQGVPKPQGRILTAALELAPRLGQKFGEELLDRLPGQLEKNTDAEETAVLLEKGLLLAGHLDRKDDVQRLFERLQTLLQPGHAIPQPRLLALISGTFRVLRKFGLRELVATLLQRLESLVQAEAASPRPPTTNQSSEQSKGLILLIEIAAGWFFFGEDAKARKMLDDARSALLDSELMPADRVKTACAYLSALGQAPMELALARMQEFFRKVEGIYDNYTTVSHYSLTRLMVVEAMMLALISDDFTLDREARQRLDEDEYLVRRRIHRDVREAMAEAG